MGFGPFFLKSGQGNVPGRPLRSAGGSEPLQHSYSAERLSLGIGLESGMRLSRPIAREALLFFAWAQTSRVFAASLATALVLLNRFCARKMNTTAHAM